MGLELGEVDGDALGDSVGLAEVVALKVGVALGLVDGDVLGVTLGDADGDVEGLALKDGVTDGLVDGDVEVHQAVHMGGFAGLGLSGQAQHRCADCQAMDGGSQSVVHGGYRRVVVNA